MTNEERKVMELALEALESGVKTTADRISWTEYDCELMEQAITATKEALAQPEKKYTVTRNAWTGKATYKCMSCGRDDFSSEHGAHAHICEALAQPEQEPKCNPHPKAPHGFNRNASHANDRYTCECEGWDAYDAGYQAGVLAGIEASTGQEPEQEPVAVVTGVYGGRFTYAPIKASVILPVGMALYTRPQPRKPLTGEVVVIAAQSCLSPQQYDHFEALLENDQDAHNRLARAIEAAHNIKE